MDSTLQSDSGQASSPRVELNEVLAGHIQTELGASYPDYRVTKVCVPDCPACAQRRLVEWLDRDVSEGCDDRVGGLHEPDCQCGFGIYIGYQTWQALKKALEV